MLSETQNLWKLEQAFDTVLAKLPMADRAAIQSLWLGGLTVALVPDLKCLGFCSDDGLTIAVSRATTGLHPRGLQLVLAHEIAHAYQIATGQVVADKQAMERGAERIMREWGFNDEEIEFWTAYATVPKEAKRFAKNALMRKDKDLMMIFAEWRSENEMAAA